MKTLARIFVQCCFGLLVIAVFWSCSMVPGAREEGISPVIRVPFVRVLLTDDKPDVSAEADGSLAIECLTNGVQRVYYAGQVIMIRNVGGKLRLENDRGDLIEEDVDEVNLLPRGRDSRVKVNERSFRGILKALPYQENVRLVNIVYMEDYLRGVVPPEIGKRTDDEVEAIKAQAIAARTYTIKHLQQYEGEPYDMKSTTADQLYEGFNAEVTMVDKAIESTTGQVIMYQDDFINAYYHSTCAGTTDEISQVWDKPAMPYLVPVQDSGACAWSKYFTWREDFTEPQLRANVEAFLTKDRGHEMHIDTILDVRIEDTTAGGRVAKLLVRTVSDNYRFYKDRIRWVIMRTSNPALILPSDKFEVRVGRNELGDIEEISFLGGGYGHGVGMCQCGAIGMSRMGWRAEQILRYYYAGVDIKKLY